MSDKGNRAGEEYLRYTSLEHFEPMRLEIARAISERMSIPMAEFEGESDGTAFFHWITSLLAVEKWLRATTDDEADIDADSDWRIARNKLAAAALLRLFHHRFNLDIDDRSVQFLDAFGNVAQTNEKILKILFYGWDFMRSMAGEIAVHWWQNQSLPILKEDHFAEIDETIEESGEEFEFLNIAYRDAVMQMAMEFDLLQKIQTAGNIGLAFPEEMPEDADGIGVIGGVKKYLSQAAVIRYPVSVDNDKVGKALSFGEAVKSLKSEKPKILVEAVYDAGDGKEAVVFVPIHIDDGSANFLLPRLTEAGLHVNAACLAMI